MKNWYFWLITFVVILLITYEVISRNLGYSIIGFIIVIDMAHRYINRDKSYLVKLSEQERGNVVKYQESLGVVVAKNGYDAMVEAFKMADKKTIGEDSGKKWIVLDLRRL